MIQREMTPESTEFVILCFEGPDDYSRAGGLGVRVEHLSATLAQMGFSTHLFFVGDPKLPGLEVRHRGRLKLHRWCQWISEYYPKGAYEGENEKLFDFNESIPAFVRDEIVGPAVRKGKLVVILGEEWQTAEAMCRLSDTLHYDGLRDQVVMFWNANNTFSFHRINWGRLNYAVTITTVSRYMKHLMWRMKINPLVIPNGIPRNLFRQVAEDEITKLREVLHADMILCKIARWDPNKCWDRTIEATSALKARGMETVLLARGGIEAYGQEVIARARALGLSVREARIEAKLSDGYISAFAEAVPADMIDVKFHLPADFLRVMYRASDAVLANSGHEPFGLVGLEAMAAGGMVFTGSTGEDYAIPFVNSIVLETGSPEEIVSYLMYLQAHPDESERMRKMAMRTARSFTWQAAAHNLIGKLEAQARLQGILGEKPSLKKSVRAGASIAVVPQPGGEPEPIGSAKCNQKGFPKTEIAIRDQSRRITPRRLVGSQEYLREDR